MVRIRVRTTGLGHRLLELGLGSELGQLAWAIGCYCHDPPSLVCSDKTHSMSACIVCALTGGWFYYLLQLISYRIMSQTAIACFYKRWIGGKKCCAV